jgi:hypothetical protein
MSLPECCQSAQRRTRQRVTGEEDQDRYRPGIETLLRMMLSIVRRRRLVELRKSLRNGSIPKVKLWLPLFHTQQEGWDFTVLFSNTPASMSWV